MFQIKNEIVVDSIKPDWLRREIAEAVSKGDSITIGIFHGGIQKSEYYVRLKDRNLVCYPINPQYSSPVNPSCLKDCEELKYEYPRNA